MAVAPDRAVIRFFTDVWPLVALGVIGALLIRACVPVHPAAQPLGTSPPPPDPQTAVRIGNSRATAALNALTPESSPAQAIEALNSLQIDFSPASSALPPSAEPVLVQVAAAIAARPLTEHFEISAHADGTGSPLADLELSRRRAQAVVDFLVNQGVPGERLQAHGEGDEDTVAGEPGAEARQRGKHLEFALLP
jgi:outer membrane protein OmpA-like peptidoglycan-associated protein